MSNIFGRISRNSEFMKSKLGIRRSCNDIFKCTQLHICMCTYTCTHIRICAPSKLILLNIHRMFTSQHIENLSSTLQHRPLSRSIWCQSSMDTLWDLLCNINPLKALTLALICFGTQLGNMLEGVGDVAWLWSFWNHVRNVRYSGRFGKCLRSYAL